jgi:hypothetical protein
VATVERRNPIPAGRYWVDCIGNPAITEFDIWRRSHQTVVVEETEGDTTAPMPTQFVIFHLTAPTQRWEQMSGGVGMPTIAPPEVKSKADAFKVPTVAPFSLDFLNDSSTLLLVAVGLFLLLRKK